MRGEAAAWSPRWVGFAAGRYGTLTPDSFDVDGSPNWVSFLVHNGFGLYLGLMEAAPSDFVLRVGESEYAASQSSTPLVASGDAAYWWPAPTPEWTAGDLVEVSLMSTTDPLPAALPAAPLTAHFLRFPPAHNGSDEFTLILHFGEPTTATAAGIQQALVVEGGEIVAVHDGLALSQWAGMSFAVTLRPASRSDITVAMPAAASCDSSGAVCTQDGRMLPRGIEASIAGPLTVGPLTAEVHDPPASHDGQTAFTFELRFSEEPRADFSYKTLTDRAFTVTGGSVVNARRLARPSNVMWEITVSPRRGRPGRHRAAPPPPTATTREPSAPVTAGCCSTASSSRSPL